MFGKVPKIVQENVVVKACSVWEILNKLSEQSSPPFFSCLNKSFHSSFTLWKVLIFTEIWCEVHNLLIKVWPLLNFWRPIILERRVLVLLKFEHLLKVYIGPSLFEKCSALVKFCEYQLVLEFFTKYSHSSAEICLVLQSSFSVKQVIRRDNFFRQLNMSID